MERYGWIVGGLNVAVDFLLLMAVCRWEGISAPLLRLGTAALAGGGYAAACLLPQLNIFAGGVWQILCLATMSLIAFGMEYDTIRRGCVFSVLWLAMHGLALGFQQKNVWSGILWGALVLLVYLSGLDGKRGEAYIPVQIRYHGKLTQLTALRDTGNQLCDPVSGKPVLVVGPRVAGELLGLTRDQLNDPVTTLECHKIPGLRLVPYRSVGQGGGLLLAMHFTDVLLGEQQGAQIVAFCPNTIGSGGNFEALAGGAV